MRKLNGKEISKKNREKTKKNKERWIEIVRVESPKVKIEM